MGRLARKEGWRKVNRLEEEPGRPGGRKGSTGVEVESTGVEGDRGKSPPL